MSNEKNNELINANISFARWALRSSVFVFPFGLWFFSTALFMPSFVLFFALWTLAVWDSFTYRLPNLVVLALFVAGLIVTLTVSPEKLPANIIGAGAGLLFPIVLNFIYRHIRGHDGIGLGDAKLLAAAGIWAGWQALPLVLLTASVSGLTFVLIQMLRGVEISSQTRIPFGPFICLGIWVAWLFF